MKACTPFALALLAGSTALMAQTVTTTTLAGEVRDSAGKPVPGATLTLASPALIAGARQVSVASNGSFRAPVLPPGVYRVTASAPGRQTVTQELHLSLGATTFLKLVIPDAASAVVQVVASSASMDAAPATTNLNFTTEQLETLPFKRDMQSIMNLTPGIVGGVAWGGDRSNANAYLLDGINVGDPLFGTQYVYANPDWFEEVQVGGLGAPAEYGGFTGGYINSVVKRGGNTHTGSLNGYFSPDTLRSRPKLEDPRLVDNSYPTKDWDLGINLGGPIVKDRLWYFISAEKIVSQQTPVGAPVPVDMNNRRLLGKFSWQVSQTSTLEAFGAFDGLDREHRGITNLREPDASSQQTGSNRTFGLTWTQSLGNQAVLTVKGVGYSGSYRLGEYNPGVPPIVFSTSYRGLAYYRNPTTVEEYVARRGTLSAVLDVYTTGLLGGQDSHAFRIGFEREQSVGEEQTGIPGGLVYNATVNATTGNPRTSYVSKGGNISIHGVIDRTVVFAHDVWTVNSRLKVQPGLRFETFSGRPFGGEALWKTNTLAPRLGLTVDLTGTQKYIAKVHVGRYFDGLSLVYFDRALPGAYSPSTRHYWGSGATFAPVDFTLTNPEAVPYNPTPYRTAADTNTSKLNPSIKHPYTDEALVALEVQVTPQWAVNGSFAYRKSKDLLTRVDRAQTGGFTERVFDPVTQQSISVFDATNATPDYFIDNDGRARRSYQALTLGFDRKGNGRWHLGGSYTRALRKGNLNRSNGYDDAFANPNYQINFDGKLPYFNDDEVKLRSSLRLFKGTRLSASFTYLSGEHYTRTLATPDLAVSRLSYTVFAEGRGASSYPCRRLLDLHLSQELNLGKRVRAEVLADAFNVFNTGTPTTWTTRSNDYRTRQATDANALLINRDYLKPTGQEEPRSIRLGLRLKF